MIGRAKSFLLVAGASVALVSDIPAELLVLEAFDYSNDTRLSETNAGGIGWAIDPAGWRSRNLLNLISQLKVTNYPWTASCYGYSAAAPKALRNDTGGVARVGARYLDSPIDADTNAPVYFSYLLRPDGPDGGGWVNFCLRNGNSDTSLGGTNTILVQYSGGGSNLVVRGPDPANAGTGDKMSMRDEYLVVGRITFGAGEGADTLSAAFFPSRSDMSSEPSWTSGASVANVSATFTGRFDNVAFRMNNDSLVGSLRLGTSYQDVVPYVAPPAFPVLEPVHYPTGRLENTETLFSGAGWANGWSALGNPLASPGSFSLSTLAAYDKTWADFTNYVPLAKTLGGALGSYDGAANRFGSRAFAEPLDPQPESNRTLYFSYLLNPDPVNPGWLNFGLRHGTGNPGIGTPQSLQVQYDGVDNAIDIQASGAGGGTVDALTPGEDHLVVGRLVLSSNDANDNLAVAFFDAATDSSSEPDWTGGAGHVANTGPTDFFTDGTNHYLIDNFTLWIDDGTLIGSIRLGDTYAEVAPAKGAVLDADRDGMSDTWETEHYGCAICGVPCDDSDNDDTLNVNEYVADTIPTNPASVLALTNVAWTPSGLALSWTGGSNAVQVLQSAPAGSLSGTWSDLYTNPVPTPVQAAFTNPAAAPGESYRLRAFRP